MCPSGADFASVSTAISPVAPVRLSMTTDWPQASVSLAPRSRATTSGAEPGPFPTIMRTGRTGKRASAARDWAAGAGSAARSSAPMTSAVFMRLLPTRQPLIVPPSRSSFSQRCVSFLRKPRELGRAAQRATASLARTNQSAAAVFLRLPDPIAALTRGITSVAISSIERRASPDRPSPCRRRRARRSRRPPRAARGSGRRPCSTVPWITRFVEHVVVGDLGIRLIARVLEDTRSRPPSMSSSCSICCSRSDTGSPGLATRSAARSCRRRRRKSCARCASRSGRASRRPRALPCA